MLYFSVTQDLQIWLLQSLQNIKDRFKIQHFYSRFYSRLNKLLSFCIDSQPEFICSKLIIKTSEWLHWLCSGVFIVNFEQTSHIVLVFPLLTWTIKCRLGLIRKQYQETASCTKKASRITSCKFSWVLTKLSMYLITKNSSVKVILLSRDVYRIL